MPSFTEKLGPAQVLGEVYDYTEIWEPLTLLTLTDYNWKTNFCLFHEWQMYLSLWHFGTMSFTIKRMCTAPSGHLLPVLHLPTFLTNFSSLSSGLLSLKKTYVATKSGQFLLEHPAHSSFLSTLNSGNLIDDLFSVCGWLLTWTSHGINICWMNAWRSPLSIKLLWNRLELHVSHAKCCIRVKDWKCPKERKGIAEIREARSLRSSKGPLGRNSIYLETEDNKRDKPII